MKSGDGVGSLGPGAQDSYRDGWHDGPRSKLGAEFEAADPGKHEIRNDQVGQGGLDRRPRLRSPCAALISSPSRSCAIPSRRSLLRSSSTISTRSAIQLPPACLGLLRPGRRGPGKGEATNAPLREGGESLKVPSTDPQLRRHHARRDEAQGLPGIGLKRRRAMDRAQAWLPLGQRQMRSTSRHTTPAWRTIYSRGPASRYSGTMPGSEG